MAGHILGQLGSEVAKSGDSPGKSTYLRRAVIVSIDGASATVNLAGVLIPGVPYYSHLKLAADDVVDLLFDGPTPRIVGVLGGSDRLVGIVAFVELANTFSQNTSSGTYQDITGMSVTFTAVANRYYKATMFIPNASHGAGPAIGVRIWDTTGSALLQACNHDDGANSYELNGPMTLISPPKTFAAGTRSIKGQFRVSGGGGTVYVKQEESGIPMLMVEDVGSAV